MEVRSAVAERSRPQALAIVGYHASKRLCSEEIAVDPKTYRSQIVPSDFSISFPYLNS
ncbi:MAG TPA: hypothetical protein V6D18_21665 [Thermosynechococcaceae cyanobacterium]